MGEANPPSRFNIEVFPDPLLPNINKLSPDFKFKSGKLILCLPYLIDKLLVCINFS